MARHPAPNILKLNGMNATHSFELEIRQTQAVAPNQAAKPILIVANLNPI